jgi:hypothetical protein
MTAVARPVAVLFARADSHYKALPGCNVGQGARRATLAGRLSGRRASAVPGLGVLRHFAKPEPGERGLAFLAVEQVQRYGGALEHPAGSTLWRAARLPLPMERNGLGWTLPISQWWFGHRAEKSTWLYIVGVDPERIPPLPIVLGEATHVCCGCGRRLNGRRVRKGEPGWRPEVTKAERELTPSALAAWLVELARRSTNKKFFQNEA